jgi:polysaccharide pyruvyl transferase WcaK-like protein
VSALAASVATLIWQSRPDAVVSLLIGNRDARSATVCAGGVLKAVHTVNYRLSPRARFTEQLWWIVVFSALYSLVPLRVFRRWIADATPWIRTVVEADVVGDIRGGDSFSDIYGLKNFALDCLVVESVIWVRGGIHCLPQTYGPFRSRLAERLARRILLRAQSIWCRDRISVEEIRRLTNGRREGSLCPDVAFALTALRPRPVEVDEPLPSCQGETLIGLNVSGLLYYGGYTRSNMFRLRLDYQRFVKELAERLLANSSHRILLVPHTFAAAGRVESDPSACRELRMALPASLQQRVHVVTREYDQHEIKGVIGLCDFFIGSRMHACIAALSQDIPTAAVAYSRKFAGVFDTVGAGNWVIDGRSVDVSEAIGRIEQLLAQRHQNRRLLERPVGAAQAELARVFRGLVGPPADDNRRRVENWNQGSFDSGREERTRRNELVRPQAGL